MKPAEYAQEARLVAGDSTILASWLNKGRNDIPDWIAPHVAGLREANGTFMICTKVGKDDVQTRVLVGNIVIEREGVLHTCEASAARSLVAELDAQDAGDPARPARPIAPAPQRSKVTAIPRPSPVSVAQTRPWPAAKGNPPSVENRSPTELKLDDSYQRSTDNGASAALIKRIANGWDWRMCLPLVVSKRDDGTLWVIDGQHRLAAAKMRGDIQFLPCCVGIYGSVADEAAMFVSMNRARKPMNRLDDFHAALAGGEPEALQIHQLVTDAGLSVSRKTGSQSWAPGDVAFTSAIAKVLRKHGAAPCAEALGILAKAFPAQVLSAGSSMFTALAKLSMNPPEGYEPDRMFRALLTRTQGEWASFLSHHKGGGDDRASQLREVLLMAYEEVPVANPGARTCADTLARTVTLSAPVQP